MRLVISSICLSLTVAACAAPPFETLPDASDAASEEPQVRPEARPESGISEVLPVPGGARTAEEFDTTTAEERVAAASVPAEAAKETDLGLTVVSLGAPDEPGFWLKTPLVSAPGRGRVVYPENGKSVQVDLIPIDGPKTAGSRMSLAALRVLEAPLAGLPELRVFLLGG